MTQPQKPSKTKLNNLSMAVSVSAVQCAAAANFHTSHQQSGEKKTHEEGVLLIEWLDVDALHLACINDDLNSVEALLKPISTAELKEHRPIMKQSPQSNALQRFSVDLEQRNFYGENCVHIAAQRNQIQILKKLIQEGANVNAREGRAGYTPLHLAVETRNLEMANLLLENCKSLNTETLNYGQITAYQLACQIDQPEMMETLERNGCEVISPPESDYEDSDGLDEFDSD